MPRSSMPSGCLALVFFAALLLFPIFFTDLILGALSKLGLNPQLALLAAFGIFLGGLINIPVGRIQRESPMEVSPWMYGLSRFMPLRPQVRQYTIIAVNLGGCVIPVGIAAYELLRLAGAGSTAFIAVAAAAAVNVVVCYSLARPVPNVGIAMPTLVPGLVAALCALLFLRENAAPVAFVAGVMGPLVGADLLHLRDIGKISTGVASIGGAGTFDGIVLSGLVATVLV